MEIPVSAALDRDPDVRAFADAFPELLSEDPALLLAAIREGLPAGRFDALQRILDIATRDLLDVLGLSQSTLSRRRERGRFGPLESDRIVRFGLLVLHAVDVLEGLDHARTWLKHPVRALGGAIPLRHAALELGAREVEHLLTRLEYGVFS